MTADVRYDTVLRCDEPGCKARFHSLSDWHFTRKRAADAGWTCPSWRGDFCPEHSKAQQ